MKKKLLVSIILLILSTFLVSVGFTLSDGNPSLPLGIITWPIAFILLLFLIINWFAKSIFTCLSVTICAYLLLGIFFDILLRIIEPTGLTASHIVYVVITWPALLISTVFSMIGQPL